MKQFIQQIVFFIRNKQARKSGTRLARFLLIILFTICTYSIVFHLIMLYEGRDFSWITGLYWTLTVMSTLGFGDITFTTDLGLLFTLVVLLSGVVLLLILLPFTFIQFFYTHWLEAQKQTRTPHALPESMSGHILLIHFDTFTRHLVKKLKKYGYSYYFVTDDQQQALELSDANYKVVIGRIDNPETYRKLQVQQAALVVATADDLINTNVAFTVRAVSSTVPIVCSADTEHSLEILNFSDNTHVFQFMKRFGASLAARTIGIAEPNIIQRHNDLIIAEFPVHDTILSGKSLAQVHFREKFGVSVVAFQRQGELFPPDADEILVPSTILLMSGTEQKIKQIGQQVADSCVYPPPDPAVVILGGGRVGQAAAAFFDQTGVSYKIVEKREKIASHQQNAICGDAADIAVLKDAGIEQARSVIITTHNDAMNIYLTFYCRQLRPEIQIIARASEGFSREKLYLAGADQIGSVYVRATFVIMNILQPYEESIFATNRNIFVVQIPKSLAGKLLLKSKIKEKTGCMVLATRNDSQCFPNPDPAQALPVSGELVVYGSPEKEKVFRKEFIE